MAVVTPLSSTNTNWPGSHSACRACHRARASWFASVSLSLACIVFFMAKAMAVEFPAQPRDAQGDPQIPLELLAEFFQHAIRLFANPLPKVRHCLGIDAGLPSGRRPGRTLDTPCFCVQGHHALGPRITHPELLRQRLQRTFARFMRLDKLRAQVI
jgi:hypothetical protein